MYKVFSFIIVWLSITSNVLLAQELVWEDIGRGNLNIQVVLVNPFDNKIIFAGSMGNLLKTDNAGKSWRSVLTIRGRMRNINALAMDAINYNVIYAATDNGLYRSNNLGGRWERIFRGKNNLENQCRSVFNTSQAIFVGTKTGLFISYDSGRSWHKEEAGIGKEAVLNIDAALRQNSVIYLAAVNGAFKSVDNGKNWEKIYITYSLERPNDESVSDEESAPEKESELRFVKAGINNINLLYLSSAKGIYKSLDQGKSWEKINEYGLLNRDVKMLCMSENSQIFALSQSGVFSYDNSHWEEVSFGLAESKLSYLTLDNKSNIYITGERGIFKANLKNFSSPSSHSLMREYLKYEPKIRDVQEAAIKYAEVSPEKISGWRKKAAKKSLLPKVSIGLDRNSTDLWHWEGGSTTKTDDDTLRRGQDSIDWDVSLSWDFGDLIWNDAQTSIDVRSKLMVELRDDILDQVNKLYFERLRVKSELDNLAIEDRNKRFDKQLKLEELTASLDSLTAGYYSEQLRQLAPKA